jgi:hypothetical protein
VTQPRHRSALEAIANTAVGYVVALLVQLAAFPAFGIHIPLSSNLGIGAVFTGASLARSYLLRRVFEGWRP